VSLASRKKHEDSFGLLVSLVRAENDAKRAARLQAPSAIDIPAQAEIELAMLRELFTSEEQLVTMEAFPTMRRGRIALRRVEPTPDRPQTTRPTAEETISSIKAWDWIIAAATALAATIAFLLPKYGTHVFGTLQDYVSLATLGFLGAATASGLVLNWGLFPGLRSYSIQSVLGEETETELESETPTSSPTPDQPTT
jgi:hypothetical protein